MKYKRPRWFFYRVAQVVSWIVATFVFRRKVARNEIKGLRGPFVVIANHEAALDFVNLIGLTARRMSFVISNSFYSTLPIKGFLDKMGIIPKQQFQTSARDLKRIKSVINAGEPVVIYPAGLMCEDGLSTPIPSATYKFLRWLGVDVYMARISGSYFVMPKWAGGLRPGPTLMDVYKLISKEELAAMTEEEVREKAEKALLFDAYRDQETIGGKYLGMNDIRGLENVLYRCPNCGREFTMEIKDKSTISCSACGYAETADKMGFLHKSGEVGEEIRYVSDWSRMNFEVQKEKLRNGEDKVLSCDVTVKMIPEGKNKFEPIGEGKLTVSDGLFVIEGVLRGEETRLEISAVNIPTLPFSPGKHLEIQSGQDIYRCVPSDGRLTMKIINMVKAFYEIRKAE